MTLSEPLPQPVSPFHNLVDIIAAPATALRRIGATQPRSWWFPALLAVAGGLLYLGVTLDELAAETARQMQIQLGAMPAEQAEAARPLIERFNSPVFLFASGAVGILLGLIAAWLLAAGLLYFGAAILGASLPFNRWWAPVVWTWVPFGLRGFVQAAWSLVNGSLIRYNGLAYLVASGDSTADQANPLFALASQMDLWTLWHGVLVYLLLRTAARLGRGSAIALTLFYAVVSLGLRVLPVVAGNLFRVG
ncbi:MAG: YIP1 family protein [Caldilineales bacterium]|nr:YIP1 family protein [Caldilineales bacterium]